MEATKPIDFPVKCSASFDVIAGSFIRLVNFSFMASIIVILPFSNSKANFPSQFGNRNYGTNLAYFTLSLIHI